MVREKNRQAAILAMTMNDSQAIGGSCEAYSDEQICGREGPYALLKKVAAMLGTDMRSKITNKVERPVPMEKS
jgi:hypothetical protein